MVGVPKTYHDYIKDQERKRIAEEKRKKLQERNTSCLSNVIHRDSPQQNLVTGGRRKSRRKSSRRVNMKHSSSSLLHTDEKLKERLKGILKRNSQGVEVIEDEIEESDNTSQRSKGSMESDGGKKTLK